MCWITAVPSIYVEGGDRFPVGVVVGVDVFLLLYPVPHHGLFLLQHRKRGVIRTIPFEGLWG